MRTRLDTLSDAEEEKSDSVDRCDAKVFPASSSLAHSIPKLKNFAAQMELDLSDTMTFVQEAMQANLPILKLMLLSSRRE